MIYKDGKAITSIHKKDNYITAVHKGSRLVWELLTETQSCFANGYWMDEFPWTDDQAWVDNIN